MSINAINSSNLSFKGKLRVPFDDKHQTCELDTNKILEMEERKDSILIKYDIPVEKRHNGYTYYEPMVVRVPLDINTLLNAYNAAKASALIIDLSEHNIK